MTDLAPWPPLDPSLLIRFLFFHFQMVTLEIPELSMATLPRPPTPLALSLAGDRQISCASMVRCNNLGVSQEKAALDINVLWSGLACVWLCVCVCL